MAPFSFFDEADTRYQPVEADDFNGLERDGVDTSSPSRGRQSTRARADSRRSQLSSNWSEVSYPALSASKPHGDSHIPIRRISRDAAPLSHPSPGLQTLQGAYRSNVSRLEDSAAKMSLSMDIETELAKLREEQKQADLSRRSSLQNSIQNSRPGSRAASGLRLENLPSPNAYIPIASGSPFATSPTLSRHGSVARSYGSGPLSPREANVDTMSQSPKQVRTVSRKTSAAMPTPPLALQTVFEDGGGDAKAKEMVRGFSKTSNAYSDSVYSPASGQKMTRDGSQAYSESMYSTRSPVAPPSKPLPLRTAYGQLDSPSNHAPETVGTHSASNQITSPSDAAPEVVSGSNAYGQIMSPSDHAPEAIAYEAYTPGAVQLVHDQPESGHYADAVSRRRGSVGSMDTYQQAASAFHDFDGAHYGYHDGSSDEEEEDADGGGLRRASVATITQSDPKGRPLLSPSTNDVEKRVSFMPSASSPGSDASKTRSMLSLMPEMDAKRKSTMSMGPARPQTPPEGTVFYPAPVPAMLNLPPKLAKGPSAADIQRKKGEFVANARKSALRPGMFEPSGGGPRASTAVLDPHLKASLYFDHKPLNHELKLIDGSASKTLDAILNAASTAPLGAFTDHPYAGVLGPEVYGPPDPPKKAGDNVARRGSAGDLLAPSARYSKTPMSGRSMSGSALSLGQSEEDAAHESNEGSPLTHTDGRDEEGNEYFGGEGEEDEGPDHNNFQGDHPDYIPVDLARPSTLLAELQLRKAENKSRTRAAGTAFPNGVHSTLLQLDAVAQHQARARRGKHIRLAWEDPEMLGGDDEDEDVPLGMLMPHARRPEGSLLPPVPQSRHGLSVHEGSSIGDRSGDESEKEETLGERKARLAREAERKKFTLNVSGIEDENKADDDDDEPLAARRARLHRRKSSEFTTELMSQLGAFSVEEEQAQQQASQDSRPTKKPQPARMRSRQSLGSLAAFSQPQKPEGEETLGERRRRLQAQQAAKEDANRLQQHVRQRSSMDLLSGEPGPALIGHQATQSMATLPPMFPIPTPSAGNTSAFQANQMFPAAQSPYVAAPAQLQMPMAPGLMPGVMPASAFGYTAPPAILPAHQHMQASYSGQPAQPLGLLGAHMVHQQQMQSRGTHKVGGQQIMPMSVMQMQAVQANTAGRKDMVDRWRQGVAG